MYVYISEVEHRSLLGMYAVHWVSSTDVSKDHSAFIFRDDQAFLGLLDPADGHTVIP